MSVALRIARKARLVATGCRSHEIAVGGQNAAEVLGPGPIQRAAHPQGDRSSSRAPPGGPEENQPARRFRPSASSCMDLPGSMSDPFDVLCRVRGPHRPDQAGEEDVAGRRVRERPPSCPSDPATCAPNRFANSSQQPVWTPAEDDHRRARYRARMMNGPA